MKKKARNFLILSNFIYQLIWTLAKERYWPLLFHSILRSKEQARRNIGDGWDSSHPSFGSLTLVQSGGQIMPTIKQRCPNQLLNCSAGPEMRKAYAIDESSRISSQKDYIFLFFYHILLYAPWYKTVNLTVAFVLVFGALSFQKTWSIKKHG